MNIHGHLLLNLVQREPTDRKYTLDIHGHLLLYLVQREPDYRKYTLDIHGHLLLNLVQREPADRKYTLDIHGHTLFYSVGCAVIPVVVCPEIRLVAHSRTSDRKEP